MIIPDRGDWSRKSSPAGEHYGSLVQDLLISVQPN
jgi:hypothetical protein